MTRCTRTSLTPGSPSWRSSRRTGTGPPSLPIDRPPDLGHPYLTSQLIAYIGNKRALLRFLHEVFCHVAADAAAGQRARNFPGSICRQRRGVTAGADDGLLRGRQRLGDAIRTSSTPATSRLSRARSGAACFCPRAGWTACSQALNALPPPPEAPAIHCAPLRAARNGDRGLDHGEAVLYDGERAEDRCHQAAHRGDVSRRAGRARRAERERQPCWRRFSTKRPRTPIPRVCSRRAIAASAGTARDALTRIMAPIRLEPPVLVELQRPMRRGLPGRREVPFREARGHLLPGSPVCRPPVWKQLLHAQHHCALGPTRR